jgi:hypothetical protein
MENDDYSFPFVEADIEHGRIVERRTTIMNTATIRKCPHFIMLPDHYHPDGSCRCDDPDHIDMADWGYTWDGSSWISDEEE